MTILLLDIPGLHLGYLGCYGNDWVATPNLDRLAGEGVVFDRHFAAGPGDLATGRYLFPEPAPSPRVRYPEPWGLIDRDFFHLVKSGNESRYLDERLSRIIRDILTKLKKNAGQEKCLIWAELPDLAPPWNLDEELLTTYFDGTPDAEPWRDPPEKLPAGDEHLDRLQFTFAAIITLVDAHVGSLIDQLRERGLLDDMLLVVTSSRGLPLGEHGWIGRQRAWQHEETVHLPLLVRLPQAEEAGLRVGALTQPVDVVPTLLDHLKLSAADVHGRSLWPLIRRGVTEVRPFACSGDRVGDSVEWSLRTLDWVCLLPISVPAGDGPREPQLFIKPDDRWEVNDVRLHHLEEAERMEKMLREFASPRR